MKKFKILIVLLFMFVPFVFVSAEEETSEIVEKEVELLLNIEKGNNNSLVLKWNDLENVTSYKVYRSTKSTGGFKKISEVDNNTFKDKKLTYGTKYYYKVTATHDGNKVTSNVVNKKVSPNQVVNVTVKPGNKEVKITFDKTSNSGYEIYRSEDNKTFKKVTTIKKAKTTSYTDKKLSNNKTYYYKVRAYQTVGKKKITGPYSEVVSVLTNPGVPSVTIKAVNYKEIDLTIKKVGGSTHYQVQRSTDNKKFNLVGETESLLFNDEDIDPTVKYYYKVRACNLNNKCGKYSDVVSAKTKITSPKLSGSVLPSEANLSWSSVSYADGYELYYSKKKTKDYKKVTTTKELEAIKKELVPGTKYYFKVRTYVVSNDKKYYSSYSNIVSLKPSVKKVSNLTIIPEDVMVKLDWKNINGVNGYQVYRSKSKKGTYSLVGTVSENTFENKDLKPKTTYYYKVRAYVTVGKNKYYGSYSDVVSVKTKSEDEEKDYTKVMNSAYKYLEEFIFTRKELREELSYDYSADEVEYAITHIEVDWKEKAYGFMYVELPKEYAEEAYRIKAREQEFTEEETIYALEKCAFNYDNNAVNAANSLSYYYGEAGIRKELKERYFTDAQIEDAMNTLNEFIDYNESAKTAFRDDIEAYRFSLAEVREDLESRMFTEDQINEAMTIKDEFNFEDIALDRAFEQINDIKTKEKMTEYLTNAKFTTSEVNNTVELLFKPITSTVDKLNLNDPLMMTYGGTGSSCGAKVAIFKNPEDVLRIPQKYVHGDIIEAIDEEPFELVNSFELDFEKMNIMKQALENITPPKGAGNVNVHDTHIYNDNEEEVVTGFSYGATWLELANDDFYKDFGVKFNTRYDNYRQTITNTLKGSYTIIDGGCGSGPERPERLTQEMCDEFNLTCESW